LCKPNAWVIIHVVTVIRAYGLRFAILTDDHEPAHVHVYGDGEAKIAIQGANALPQLVWSVGFKASDRRRAMDVVLEQQDMLLAKWDEIHGS
jgi:hypothetical protein